MARGGNNTTNLNMEAGLDLSQPLTPTPELYPQMHEAVCRLDAVRARKDQVGMICLVGSHGYGLATETSDIDLRGFYVAPTQELLGLSRPPEQLESKETDTVLFEFSKFCDLALKANPNVLEILWADEVYGTAASQEIRKMRESFLSQKVKKTYLGYAMGQFQAAINGTRGTMYEKRRAKAIRHLFRLYEQGAEILETGNLSYKLPQESIERIRSLETLDNAGLKEEFSKLEERFKSIKSDLPEEPDYEKVEEAVLSVRLKNLGL